MLEKLDEIKKIIFEAEAILITAGAGIGVDGAIGNVTDCRHLIDGRDDELKGIAGSQAAVAHGHRDGGRT